MSTDVDFARALSDPSRQEIMQLCCCQWLSVGEIAEKVGLTQPTVFIREEGRQTFYTLDQSKVAACCGRLVRAFAPGQDVSNL
jgi:predicted transcriptional regulator